MNRWWSIKSTLATIFGCWWAFNAVRYHYGFMDALARSLWWLTESTRWAEGFTEDNFDKVKPGMTEADVIRLVGQPLRKTCVEWCELVYTWQIGSNLDFDWRSVELGKDGRVENVRREFFID